MVFARTHYRLPVPPYPPFVMSAVASRRQFAIPSSERPLHSSRATAALTKDYTLYLSEWMVPRLSTLTYERYELYEPTFEGFRKAPNVSVGNLTHTTMTLTVWPPSPILAASSEEKEEPIIFCTTVEPWVEDTEGWGAFLPAGRMPTFSGEHLAHIDAQVWSFTKLVCDDSRDHPVVVNKNEGVCHGQ
jgi:hypothetical protein